jgi:hypothetical protein
VTDVTGHNVTEVSQLEDSVLNDLLAARRSTDIIFISIPLTYHGVARAY